MDKLRVAVCGFGFIGTIHAKAAVECPLTDFVGVWTQADHTQDNFQQMFPDKKLFRSLEEVAQSSDVDAVVIGLPNALHLPEVRRMLSAGKHVLVEKPMALTVAEGEEMAALASSQGVALMVGHMWRFDREALALRDRIRDGEIGDIVKTKGYGIHQNWGPAGWFTQKALAGGGALIDMGVHALDTCRFLLGDPEPRSVYAHVDTRFGEYEVDDNGILLIEWDCGTTSVVESGWWQPHMDGPEASTQLFGTRGYARLFPTMAKFNDDREPWLPRFPVREDHCDQHIYTAQMTEFAQAILEGRSPVPGAREGLTILRICEAAYESARSGEVVHLSR